jgi:xylitol oxidase
VHLRNWAGNITYSTQRLHAPRTIEQLQDLVAATGRIHALGTGHSFNRVADTNGDLVALNDLDVPIEIDEHERTVTTPAGARYGAVGVALQARGLALANLGSLPHISVAGACATGTHGSGNGNRCLATQARAIEFVRADGELVRVERGDNVFGGSVLALGALGIATRITLDAEPAFDLRQDVWLAAPLDSVLDNLDEIMASGYSVSLFSDPAGADVIDKIWIKSKDATSPPTGRPATTPQHPITGQDPSASTEQLGISGPWHERLPHFRLAFTPSSGEEQQSEYLVPREHGGDAIRAVQALDLTNALQVAEFRTVAADDLWLSPCHGRDTTALHFTWFDDDAAVHDAVAMLERALAPYDARPHWGKVFLAEPAAVRAHYPQLRDFQELAAAHDPNRKFGNDFLDRFVY